MGKLRIGLIFGGRSVEHEVSIRSARSVYHALDKEKYAVVSIGIDKSGNWRLQGGSGILGQDSGSCCEQVPQSGTRVMLAPGSGEIINISDGHVLDVIDVAFPMLHGPDGEDGTLQGLLKLTGIPFVGSSTLASAVCMDKDVSKRLLREGGLKTAKCLAFNSLAVDFDMVRSSLGLPVFVKPCGAGSSVGVSRAVDRESLNRAVELAFRYDRKILIEEEVQGREIECAVLGNETVRASLPGEVIPHARHGFYSYEAKYLDTQGAELKIPADLPPAIVDRVQTTAVQVYKVLGCEGMARIDFFLVAGVGGGHDLIVNEVNTIPGFTSAVSMYPKLWGVSGLKYAELLDQLIELAMDRHAKEKRLESSAF